MKKHLISFLAILLVVILSMTSCGILGGGGDSELVEYLESKIEELEAELDELKKENFNKDNEIDKLKEENSEKDKEIGNLKDDNSSKDEEISDLKAEIKKLQDEIATLESKDAENLAKITELETAYNNKVAELEANKQANEEALAKLEADHKAKVEGLEGDIAELEAAYNSKVAELEAEKAANAEALAALKAEYEAAIEALNTENANLALQIAELEAKIQELFNNTEYTVTFDLNGGIGEIHSQTIKYKKTVSVPEAPVKEHYDFLGWYVNGVLAGFPYEVTADTDFVAAYSPTKYIITYNVNGGTMPDTYTTEYTVENGVILPIPTRSLYNFDGWYEDEKFSGNKVTGISDGDFGNKTYYAKWENATNGITYHLSIYGEYRYYTVTGYEGDDTVIVIPSSVDGIPVTHIASEAFMGKQKITSITIPNSVTSLGSSAFEGCISLTELNLGNGIEDISRRMAYGCNKLESIVVPDNVTTIDSSAFENCTSLSVVVISDSVLYIRDWAFAHCDSLTDIAIGENVISIGSYAFYDCYGLADIVMYDSVTTIGDAAFSNCTNLISLVISDSVTSIGSSAFSGCKSLTKMVIPDSVTSIGSSAFRVCTGLASVVIGDSVISIGDEAFTGCSNLYVVYNSSDLLIEIGSKNNGYVAYYAKVVVDNGDAICADDGYSYTLTNEGFLFREKDSKYELIYYVGGEETATLPFDINGNSYSLFFMEGVRNVIIPEGFIEISSNAFNNCYSLISVDIPDSIEFIGGSAFNNCNSLTSVVIGHRVTFIGYEAFYNCDSLSEVYYNGTQEDWAKIYVDSSGNDSLKNATRYYYSETHPTTEGNFWHWVDGEPTVWCYDPASIPAVDATCTETGLSEGKYCEACGETLVAQNITDVKHNFVNNICVECGEVYYSKGLVYTSNGDGTCYLSGIGTCTDTDISIPLVSPDGDIVTGIGYSAFSSCRNITSVTIPDSVTDIGDCAFQYCDNLKEVNINNLNVHVGSDAFNRCHSDLYTDYEYGRYVRVNDNPYAILVKILNTYYATYKIHEDTCVISENLFQYHSQLTSIIIPDKVKNIGNGAFYYCSNLSSVTLGKGVTRIGEDAFYRCISMTSINLPDGLVEICEDAFWITGLTSIVIPDSVTSIGNHAFEACDYLRTVVIGNGVTDIGIWAFCGCDNLSSVIIGNSVVNIGLGAFAGCTSLKSIVMSSNVSIIGDIAFRNCPYLSKVYFDGSEEDWNLINISSDENSDFTDATRYYYSETEPTEEGNFWHWVDGEVKIWE